MFNKKKNTDTKIDKNGYTLIEVVIVMMITAMVFVAIYALFAKSMKYDTEGRYEIVAAELAQEGIEIIKNKKEKNEMDWAVWTGPGNNVDPEVDLKTFKDIDNLSKCNPSLEWNPDYSFTCPSNSTTLQYDSNTKKYEFGCSGSNCTGPEFTRLCSSSSADGGDALRIECEVSWKSLLLKGDTRSVKASLVLTDWER